MGLLLSLLTRNTKLVHMLLPVCCQLPWLRLLTPLPHITPVMGLLTFPCSGCIIASTTLQGLWVPLSRHSIKLCSLASILSSSATAPSAAALLIQFDLWLLQVIVMACSKPACYVCLWEPQSLHFPGLPMHGVLACHMLMWIGSGLLSSRTCNEAVELLSPMKAMCSVMLHWVAPLAQRNRTVFLCTDDSCKALVIGSSIVTSQDTVRASGVMMLMIMTE